MLGGHLLPVGLIVGPLLGGHLFPVGLIVGPMLGGLFVHIGVSGVSVPLVAFRILCRIHPVPYTVRVGAVLAAVSLSTRRSQFSNTPS